MTGHNMCMSAATFSVLASHDAWPPALKQRVCVRSQDNVLVLTAPRQVLLPESPSLCGHHAQFGSPLASSCVLADLLCHIAA